MSKNLTCRGAIRSDRERTLSDEGPRPDLMLFLD